MINRASSTHRKRAVSCGPHIANQRESKNMYNGEDKTLPMWWIGPSLHHSHIHSSPCSLKVAPGSAKITSGPSFHRCVAGPCAGFFLTMMGQLPKPTLLRRPRFPPNCKIRGCRETLPLPQVPHGHAATDCSFGKTSPISWPSFTLLASLRALAQVRIK